MEKTKRRALNKIKNRIIDSTLLMGISVGLFAFLVAYYPFDSSKREVIFYSDLVGILILLAIYLLRNKIRLRDKATIVILVLITLIVSDTLVWGIFSMNKILIVIIPFYTLFVFEIRTALFAFFLSVSLYFFIGYFELYQTHDPSFYMRRLGSISDWVEGVAVLSIAALVILLFTNQYNGALSDLIDHLEKKNEDLETHREELKANNKKLTEALEQVQVNNKKLTEYAFINSHELRAPLAKILGLAQIVSKDVKAEKHQKLVHELLSSAEELDKVVAKINESLEEQKNQ
ncbi:histidine kinase dimerization/phospho-acceptor domain-containing protein [Reichenbachiella sp.]|uniref:histidine kinase dimerization/phospho-acceptor domain-containing protein n=1 Tax=Reichenbachiella sp. TaxID=2184521 RepID=UPI003BB21AA5